MWSRLKKTVEITKDSTETTEPKSSTIYFEQWVDNQPTRSNIPEWLNNRLKKGFLKALCTIDIKLYATKKPRKKWIEYKLTDAVGITVNMTSHDSWARGWLNLSANITFTREMEVTLTILNCPQAGCDQAVSPKLQIRRRCTLLLLDGAFELQAVVIQMGQVLKLQLHTMRVNNNRKLSRTSAFAIIQMHP